MISTEKIATRVAYGKALAEFGKDKLFAVLDADLSGSTNTAKFAEVFPERFVNCGIAEGNMVSVAAGISATGIPVFCSTFAMFAAGRAFEQIRNSVGYPHLNVKICASHGGITVGEDGASHQCLEDFALMRTIPGMTVISPADAVETRAAVKAMLDYDGPCYMRLGRNAVPQVFDADNFKFEIGKASVLNEGSDVVIFATGSMISPATDAVKLLKESGISAALVNVSTIKPLDTETVIKYAALTRHVVTVEEHSIIGGLGSAVCETLAGNCPVPVVRHGIYDEFGISGKASELLDYYHLNAAGIADAVKKVLAK